MKWAYSTVAVVILGLASTFTLFLFEEVTVSNEQDYYLIKEMTEAAMIDAIDLAYYRDTGEIKIIKEKFIENFTRRFVRSAKIDRYLIGYYDIIEEPPKVTVKVFNETEEYNIYTEMPGTSKKNNATKLNIVNENSAIINTNSCYMTRKMYSVTYDSVKAGEEFSNNPDDDQSEIREIDGYKPLKATYLKSFSEDEVDNEVLFKEYLDQKFNFYNTVEKDKDIIMIDDYDSFADIAMTSFGLLTDNKTLRYSLHAKCDNLTTATLRNGSTLNDVCMIGKIYEVLYQKDTPECKKTIEDIPKKEHKQEIIVGVDVGKASSAKNKNQWFYNNFTSSTYEELAIQSPCDNVKKINCKPVNIKYNSSTNTIEFGGNKSFIKLDNLNETEFYKLYNGTIKYQVVQEKYPGATTDQNYVIDKDFKIINDKPFPETWDIQLNDPVDLGNGSYKFTYNYKGSCNAWINDMCPDASKECNFEPNRGISFKTTKNGKEVTNYACIIGFYYAVGWEYDVVK